MLASLSQPVGSLLPPTEGTCFLLPGVLSPQECRAWIAAAEARGFEPTGGAYPPSYRDNDRLVQDDPGLAAALFARVAPHLPTHLERDGSVWRLAGLNPRFRACRYRRGQRFGVHRDGPHVAGPDLRSFLTCMLYLTDQGQHAGGATVFHRDRAAQGPPLLTVVPREGAMLVFGHDLWHEGQAVPDGTKYVLRSDVLYARHTPQRAPAAPAPCQVLRGHAGYVWRLLADPAGGLLSAGRDGAVLSWDPRALEGAPPPPLARQAGSVTALARCADGALWTGSREGALRLWPAGHDPERPALTLEGADAGAVLALLPAPQGGAEHLLVARAGGAIELRQAADARLRRVLRAHQGWVWALALGGPAQLASAGEDGTLRAWSLSSGRGELLLREPGPLRALAALAAGALAWGTACGLVRRRDADGRVTTLGRHAGAVRALLSLPGGGLASGGEDDQVRVWGPTGELQATLPHGDFVTALALLPGGRLASASYDALVRVWRPTEGAGAAAPERASGVSS